MPELKARTWATPIGELFAVTDRADRLKILVMNWPKRIEILEKAYQKKGLAWRWHDAAALQVEQQLAEYFAGERREFQLELAPEGTPFQHQVWQELAQIPFGVVTSYGALAEKMGNPKASRGVGSANGANPICIVVPCHRVVGSDGRLTGFAYGVHVKAELLNLEGHRVSTHQMPRILEPGASDQMALF